MEINEDERGGLLSASSGERIYRCLGSLKAAQEAKAQGLEPAREDIAKQGDRIHKKLQEPDEEENEDEEEENDEALTEEEKEIANNLSEIGKEALEDWRLERAVSDPEITREERLWIRDENLQPIASAKPDLSARSGLEGFVLDYKSGFIPITDAPSNIQLRIQALALWHESGKELGSIRVAAAQYRIFGKKVYADYTEKSLQMAEKELELVLWRAKQDNAPRVPGPWCTYCPAISNCRENAAYSLLPVPVMAMRGGLKPGDLSGEDVMELIPKLSPQELYALWSRSSLIYKVLKAVGARLRQMPDRVLDDLGLKIGPPRQVRKIVDIQAAWESLKDTLTTDEFLDCCKVTLIPLEEVYARKTTDIHGTIKSGKMAFDQMLKGSRAIVVTNQKGQLKLKDPSQKVLVDSKPNERRKEDNAT